MASLDGTISSSNDDKYVYVYGQINLLFILVRCCSANKTVRFSTVARRKMEFSGIRPAGHLICSIMARSIPMGSGPTTIPARNTAVFYTAKHH